MSVRISRLGFTLVEVLIVTVVVAVIASITTISYSRTQADARDNTRAAHAALVAAALEKYYDEHGEYPSPRALASTYGVSGDTVASKLSLTDKTTVLMPKASSSTTNSIAAALGTDDVLAYTATSTVGNDNCQTNAQAGCEAFTLQYKKESDGSTVTITSTNHTRPDDNTSPLEAPNKPTLAAAQSGATIVATSSATACATDPVMTANYSFRTQVGAGAWSAWSSWQTGTTYTTSGPTNGTTYSYQVHTRCATASQFSDTSVDSDVASVTYYVPPSAPATPSVGLSTSGNANATATVGGSTCNVGTLQYLIDARTNDGAWSAGSWGTGTTRTVGANQGTKYGFRATARCTNGTQTTTGATSGEATVVTGIDAPGAPNVSGSGPTWSWSPVSCPSGTTPKYSYQFVNYVSAGGWSGDTSVTSATNAAATAAGMYYGIQVVQACYSSYTSSGWSGAGAYTTYIVPVPHPKIQYAAMLLNSSFKPVVEVKTFVAGNGAANGTTAAGGVCPSGTTRQVVLYGNYDETTNNWQVDTGSFANGGWSNAATQAGPWFSATGANTQHIFPNSTVATGHYFEVTAHARCANLTTGYVYTGYNFDGNHDTYGLVYDIGNLYKVSSTQYNISCQPTNSGDSYCSGGYNSSGTLTDSSIDVCRVFSNGIATASQQYTDRIALGSATKNYCW
jgi:prepilin-type N-terminal cleavage/methylation domain-containing protein